MSCEVDVEAANPYTSAVFKLAEYRKWACGSLPEPIGASRLKEESYRLEKENYRSLTRQP